ncbi:MAG: glycosyl hydrolase 115 family protein [Bacteroidaceae bacterium]|nr:glycosyl hydrolase 115 family protein [Bacteroidaceae bacterium]
MPQRKITLILFLSIVLTLNAAPLTWYDGKNAITYSYMTKVENVVRIASEMFAQDMAAVTGTAAKESPRSQKTTELPPILLYQLDNTTKSQKAELKKSGIDADFLLSSTDAFQIKVSPKENKQGRQQLLIVGSNGRGVAYGLLELSRMAGVSPWIWWGDVIPEKKSVLTINPDTDIKQSASVQLRGIFLNDEDWSLRRWSYLNYEPAKFGQIGPQTYKKIFQLLLRLRANAVWPAMHTGTEAFFKNPKNKAMADSCGIFVGTSHCEPLLRNNVDEWNEKERGAFNYITNKEQVHKYWTERLQEVKNSTTNIFTIGMRGIHDGSMEGVKTTKEKFNALQQVIDDQQELIRKNIGNPSKQPQVFVPYKEVLELYEQGLKVPDYVTLMWCDDNYGYITRLSTSEEQKRSGGAGVYYHLSYWGRPHDYLWLTTTQPGLIYSQMRAAYDHNARKLWIVNVHDPKVAGYDLELFLDMAWNINSVSGATLENHYKTWLCRQFGEKAGEKIFPAMREFWRLTGERKPEFMGWNQNELDKKIYERGLSPVKNTEFSFSEFGSEADRYLSSYAKVANVIETVGENDIRPELKDAYFAAIEYPVLCSCKMAVKMLEAQRARSFAVGSTLKDMDANQETMKLAAAKSQQAYQDIRSLTDYYNNKMACGKWLHLMDMNPRNQHVFQVPQLPILLTDCEVEETLKQTANSDTPPDGWKNETSETIVRNADSYDAASNMPQPIQLLGHSLNATAIAKNQSLTYKFTTETEGNAVLHTALIPTQPNDGGDLRYSVSVDGGEPIVYNLKEKFRSEQWKLNVLRGQARRSTSIRLGKGNHTLEIKALDDNIIFDQWMIDFNTSRKHYLFP